MAALLYPLPSRDDMAGGPLLVPYESPTLRLRNRIAMAPMTRNRADDRTGVPTPLMTEYYAQRSTAGIIVSEGIWPSATAKGEPNVPGLVTDEHVAGWQHITGAVHAAGGTIFAQLWNVGRMTHPLTLPERQLPMAPSAIAIRGQIHTVEGKVDHVTPRAMTIQEVANAVVDFVRAARNAIRAGFDGVEIHAANGYLIQQFLAENTNIRTDMYGGSLANRLRFPLDAIAAVVAEVGSSRVGIRISPDSSQNDIAEVDPQRMYRTLVGELDPGMAYLHVVERGKYPAVSDLRSHWSGPLVANYDGSEPNSQAAGERAVTDGVADIVSYGRLFIANPDLPARVATGAPLNAGDPQYFHGGGARGYIDYPTLDGN